MSEAEAGKKEAIAFFDEERAKSYDRRGESWAPMRDAALLFLQVALAAQALPENSRVLCVGVGTGTELIHLARCFPGWKFVAVEPAPAMMGLCRKKIREAGLEERCEFHQGYLETLEAGEVRFDAATCLLVSHFITDRGQRTAFFRGIGSRLKMGGALVTADLTGSMAGEEYWRLRPVWVRLLMTAGIEGEELEGWVAAHGTAVDLLSPEEMREMLQRAGFGEVTGLYQCLLVCGWLAKWQGEV